jgi:hypothetical protein
MLSTRIQGRSPRSAGSPPVPHRRIAIGLLSDTRGALAPVVAGKGGGAVGARALTDHLWNPEACRGGSGPAQDRQVCGPARCGVQHHETCLLSLCASANRVSIAHRVAERFQLHLKRVESERPKQHERRVARDSVLDLQACRVKPRYRLSLVILSRGNVNLNTQRSAMEWRCADSKASGQVALMKPIRAPPIWVNVEVM